MNVLTRLLRAGPLGPAGAVDHLEPLVQATSKLNDLRGELVQANRATDRAAAAAQFEGRAAETLHSAAMDLRMLRKVPMADRSASALDTLASDLQKLEAQAEGLKINHQWLEVPPGAVEFSTRGESFHQVLNWCVGFAATLRPKHAGYFIHQGRPYAMVSRNEQSLREQVIRLTERFRSGSSPELAHAFEAFESASRAAERHVAVARIAAGRGLRRSLDKLLSEAHRDKSPALSLELRRQLMSGQPGYLPELRWAVKTIYHRKEAESLVRHWLNGASPQALRTAIATYAPAEEAASIWLPALERVTNAPMGWFP